MTRIIKRGLAKRWLCNTRFLLVFIFAVIVSVVYYETYVTAITYIPLHGEQHSRWMTNLTISPIETESGSGQYTEFAIRQHHVEHVCRRLGLWHSHSIPRDLDSPRFFLDNIHNVSYCGIRKAGVTFWKRVLRIAGGLTAVRDPFNLAPFTEHQLQHEYAKWPPEDQSWTSFMFARNPWSRIYSGYVDKVISLETDFWPFRYSIRAFHRPHKLVQADCVNERPCTFQELVQYVTYKMKNKTIINNHFYPMFQDCMPCAHGYNFIGKLETFKKDAKIILKTMDLEYIDPSKSDFDARKVNDDIRWVAQMALYNLFNKRHCTKVIFIWDAMWTTLKMRGLIHKDTALPAHAERNFFWITEEQLIQIIKLASNKADAKSRKTSKNNLMKEEFMTLTKKDIDEYYEAFKLDFELFDYPKWPSILGKESLNN